MLPCRRYPISRARVALSNHKTGVVVGVITPPFSGNADAYSFSRARVALVLDCGVLCSPGSMVKCHPFVCEGIKHLVWLVQHAANHKNAAYQQHRTDTR